MKTLVFLLSLLSLSAAAAQEPVAQKEAEDRVAQQLGYASFGIGPLPVLLPNFGMGYRIQRDHHGADLSLQVATIVSVTQLKTNFLYHYYFRPSLASQFYIGGGVGPSFLFGDKKRLLISPEFVFGKQYRNESNDVRFLQAQVSFPTCSYHNSHAKVLRYPLVVLSYGIAF